ncbi:MAG: hypothetical protein Q7K35_00240 [bacterium]|nr:hypothetical protein [bacterium]
MKNYFKPKAWLIMILMLIIAIGFSSAVVYFEFGLEKNIKITRASAADNVTGWAWNANTGWISFNCDHTTDGTSPPINTCGTSEYGVKIDLVTGDFSGYAWSSSVGWISFNRSDTGDPPDQPYKNGVEIANNNSAGVVDGWARILSFKPSSGVDDNNGWVKLRKFPADGGSDYGVTINPATSEFSGWAWNANDGGAGGIGWISFNSTDCDKNGNSFVDSNIITNGCNGNDDSSTPVINYKVIGNINSPPTAINLTAPNWSYNDARTNALYANLKFSFVDTDAGSFANKYQIIVTRAEDNFVVLNTGECTGAGVPSADCKIDNSICMKNGVIGCIDSTKCVCQFPLQAELNYGAGYKWSVQVWDNHGAASVPAQYDCSIPTNCNGTGKDTDNNDGVVATFTTYKHKFPLPNATWFPLNPSRGEEVEFTDDSRRYFSAPKDPTNPELCTAATCDWSWKINGIEVANVQNPTIIFDSTGVVNVKLTVTDETDTGNTPYYNEKTLDVDVNANLPGWKEVKPE